MAGFRITEIHAIVGIDDDDEEGVPAMMVPGGSWVPLIAADEYRLSLLIAEAQKIADATGLKFEIVRFTVREHVGEIRSKKLQ